MKWFMLIKDLPLEGGWIIYCVLWHVFSEYWYKMFYLIYTFITKNVAIHFKMVPWPLGFSLLLLRKQQCQLEEHWGIESCVSAGRLCSCLCSSINITCTERLWGKLHRCALWTWLRISRFNMVPVCTVISGEVYHKLDQSSAQVSYYS